MAAHQAPSLLHYHNPPHTHTAPLPPGASLTRAPAQGPLDRQVRERAALVWAPVPTLAHSRRQVFQGEEHHRVAVGDRHRARARRALAGPAVQGWSAVLIWWPGKRVAADGSIARGPQDTPLFNTLGQARPPPRTRRGDLGRPSCAGADAGGAPRPARAAGWRRWTCPGARCRAAGPWPRGVRWPGW